MRTRVVHMIPVFSPDDEPGWLILARRRNDKMFKFIKDIHEDLVSWEPAMKSWFVHHDRIEDAIAAIESACYVANPNDSVSFCEDCSRGDPCEKWFKIRSMNFILREPEEVEPPNRAAIEYADDLFEWWEAEGRSGPPMPWEGFVFNQTPPPPRPNPGNHTSGRYTQNPLMDEEFLKAMGGLFNRFVEEVLGSGFRDPYNTRRRSPPPSQPGDAMRPEEAAKILGLTLPCTKDQLASAYKQAALKAHPDRGGSNEAMAKVNIARDVLIKRMHP